MKKYTVHFSGYYGYDVNVEAENEEDAIAKAEPIFEETDDISGFTFEPESTDVFEY